MRTTIAMLMLWLCAACARKDTGKLPDGAYAISGGVAKPCGDLPKGVDLGRVYCQDGVVMDGTTGKPWKAATDASGERK